MQDGYPHRLRVRDGDMLDIMPDIEIFRKGRMGGYAAVLGGEHKRHTLRGVHRRHHRVHCGAGTGGAGGRVSPAAAVSGNTDAAPNFVRAANTKLFKIETSLGVHHAIQSKKNLILMTGPLR